MASKRELRSAGSTTVQSLDSTKNYKLNSSGSLVESTGTPGGTEIVFSGSKSSLRRLADLERNVSILAAKALSDDGSGSGYSGDVDYSRTAGKWSSARTLSLTGDVTGSASIDGSGNVSLSTTVASNTVALGTDTTGNYMVNVSAGTGISVSHTQGEGSTATISLSASTSNVSEGTNLYYTDARARAAHSFTAGSGAYNSSTGVITIPTNTNQLTNGAGFATTSYVDSAVAGKDNTDEITEGSTNLFFTNARARGAVSASGSLSYNSSTGVFSYTTPSTSGISEGTNLYHTTARARGAVSFTAGSGAYNSSTGVITIPTNTNQLTNGAGFVTSSGVTAVTATGPVASSGGATPVISMPAATASVDGYMTSTFASKLNGIAAGATNVTNTNQLTNGAGYVTSSGVTSVATGNGLTGGTITGTGTLSMSGSYSGTFAVTGAITATGEVTAYFSDANLKKDIVEITDPIAKLMSIRGVTFRPNETALALGVTDKEEVGVIAQEVEAVLPQLVTPSAFKGYKTVKYDKLTALLVEAVKAQQLQIDALRAEIAKLGGSATTEL